MKPEPSPIEDPIVKIEPDSDGETAGKRKRDEPIVPDFGPSTKRQKS